MLRGHHTSCRRNIVIYKIFISENVYHLIVSICIYFSSMLKHIYLFYVLLSHVLSLLKMSLSVQNHDTFNIVSLYIILRYIFCILHLLWLLLLLMLKNWIGRSETKNIFMTDNILLKFFPNVLQLWNVPSLSKARYFYVTLSNSFLY